MRILAGYVQHVDDSSSLGLSVKVTREANFGLERGAASLANKDPLLGRAKQACSSSF